MGVAKAEVIIVQKEKFCGKIKIFEMEDRIKYTYFAVLVLDKPSLSITQTMLDQAAAEGGAIGLWLTDYTMGAEEAGAGVAMETLVVDGKDQQVLTVPIAKMNAKLIHNRCYCIDGDAGGDIGLMGFQAITKIETADCAAD